MGIFEKSGDYVGIFEGKNWWGQVGIFGNRDGDFQPKPCGNTDSENKWPWRGLHVQVQKNLNS